MDIDEGKIRLGFFFGVLIIMALWEGLFPRRDRVDIKSRRWFNNLSITFLDTFIARILIPIFPFTLALYLGDNGVGLFNMIGIPIFIKIIIAFLILDLAIYWQHVIFHKVKILWKLHLMHHTDLDLDVTSGLRFHPLEIILSFIIKLMIVALLGIPAMAVLIFEVVLNASAMFNHANAYIPKSIDGFLRLFLVTPDMHRLHHSIHMKETNSNYGFNLSWWDHIFKTYTAEPKEGHKKMKLGLLSYRDGNKLRLWDLLTMPFNPLNIKKR